MTEAKNPIEATIVAECEALSELLIAKNRKYGNSALEPIRIFSSADASEQIKVRIDDKLSRLVQGRTAAAQDDEDVVFDLLGYLILLRVQQRAANGNLAPVLTAPIQDGSSPGASAEDLADDFLHLIQFISTGKLEDYGKEVKTELGKEVFYALRKCNFHSRCFPKE